MSDYMTFDAKWRQQVLKSTAFIGGRQFVSIEGVSKLKQLAEDEQLLMMERAAQMIEKIRYPNG